MRIMFDHRPAKMELRKQFEKRVWRGDEAFNDYFYDKTILANKVPVDENELVDYIIDGITDETMQNQARMQNFKVKEDLLKAFEKITIRTTNKNYARDNNTGVSKTENRRKTNPQISPQETATQNKAETTKCYNCNQLQSITHCQGMQAAAKGERVLLQLRRIWPRY